ncbi:hypothetical protein Mgra_00010258 [Meloidogyne graminicola]|uniref:Uncharacterized protein n=1 Tax=Meloidogyne graminicola TaxID=189291 RepID=A0A8S9ZB48_9BILA|nr:hypothetical protein Mgra_00010258 [Meloidogyne graminicola]
MQTHWSVTMDSKECENQAKGLLCRFWINVNFVEETGRCCPRSVFRGFQKVCSMWEIRMWYKSDVKAKAIVAQIRKKRIL